MGYEIYITRQENWYDDDPLKQITLPEWKSYIESDAEMRLDGFAEASLDNGDKIRMENEGIAVWTKYPGDDTAWLYFSDGNISAKNPDKAIMKKMLGIAGRLQARMQGEEGEVYNLAEINKTAALTDKYMGKRKPWWKFW